MILAIKTDDRVYVAFNGSHFVPSGTSRSVFDIKENLPFFFVKGKDNVLVTSLGGFREVDLLRYHPILTKELSIDTLISEILPMMYELFKRYFLIENNGEFRQRWLFAEDDKLILLHYNKSVCNILSHYTSEYPDIVETCFELYKEYHPIDKIKATFLMIEKLEQVLAYPITIIDTKTKDVRTIWKENEE